MHLYIRFVKQTIFHIYYFQAIYLFYASNTKKFFLEFPPHQLGLMDICIPREKTYIRVYE